MIRLQGILKYCLFLMSRNDRRMCFSIINFYILDFIFERVPYRAFHVKSTLVFLAILVVRWYIARLNIYMDLFFRSKILRRSINALYDDVFTVVGKSFILQNIFFCTVSPVFITLHLMLHWSLGWDETIVSSLIDSVIEIVGYLITFGLIYG